MGNLFTTLLNSTGSLQVFNRSFNVIQNNISNVNTPGYSRQEQPIVALPFDPAGGLTGGILPGSLQSARSEFLDQSVRNQQEHSGSANQRTADLGQVEPLFSLTSQFGIPVAFNQFFNSFSQLAVNPNDPVSRQTVIDAAGTVTDSFHRAAAGISQVVTNVDRQTNDSVAAINRLADQIAGINTQFRANSEAANDAGLEAQLSASLEELSGVANFTLIKTKDGGANVYLGGQVPLVIGDHQFPVQADLSSAQTVIRDAGSNDITGYLTGGRLGALLTEKNTTLPGYQADLHTLAANFADTVNSALAQGVDRDGAPPAVNLFSYNSADDAAFSIAVTNITPDQIAAAQTTAPGGNANALAIAGLADAPTIGSFTFTQFYGNLGSKIGRDVSSAKQDQQQSQDSLTQAQAQRQQQSGVSLDEEAAKLLQFQQAYQAVGKLVSVLNSLTDTLMNMIP